ncbi:VOC family protein [Paenibacillus kandeliae]|uniref:VOC family protein n=1 Tax=Paenibacillus kandeliae TaxID=3231269 RepID=UPI00345B3A49
MTRGLDHIGITVPDIEQATLFFEQAFEARFVYDNIGTGDSPQEGSGIEHKLGLPAGSKVVRIRMLRIGNSAGIELFQFAHVDQQRPALASDYGLQHAGFYVDDIHAAAARFQEAGGELLSDPSLLSGSIESGENNSFVYGRTPWGMVIELISYPSGIQYPKDSEAHRFTPEK